MTISLSQLVSVALVLAVVYYIMSMIISGITKWILDVFETRGRILEEFLKNSLENGLDAGKTFTIEKLKNAPQINSLRPVRYAAGGFGKFFANIRLSNYVERINPKVLVDALFDIEGTAADWKGKIRKLIGLLPDEFPNLSGEPTPFQTKKNLIEMVDQNYYTFEQWREKLETYFGSVMDQAAQKFKAVARTGALWISLALAFSLGVDSIQIAGRAWYDPLLTQKADAYAQTILQADEASQEEQQADLEALYATLDDLAVINLPWYARTGKEIISYPWYIQPPLVVDDDCQECKDLVSPYTRWSLSQPYGVWLFLRILGIILTGIAVSQGSSFWYDIIRQIKGEQKKTGAPSREAPGTTAGELETTPPGGWDMDLLKGARLPAKRKKK
ncbi:MAG: hypothetical protein FJZ96_00460 [Chloroflexi bacterium]|nr:hypothetical protein [Chloroflexota bacterium]